MRTTEHAAAIRQTLKTAHRWTSRDVSVRADSYSMGSSIDIIIKNPAVPIGIVEAIAKGAESIRRCEATGEILSGGNRYVSVKYSSEARAALAAVHAAAVDAAIGTLRASGSDGSLFPIAGTPYLIGWTNHGRGAGNAFALWSADRFETNAYSAADAAAWVGVASVRGAVRS